MSDSIKLCPFCCGQFAAYNVPDGWYIKCHVCLARGPLKTTKSEAIADWNAAPRLIEAESAVLDAAVEYAKAMDERWRGPDAEDVERKGEVRLALNVLLGGARALARERRGGSDG